MPGGKHGKAWVSSDSDFITFKSKVLVISEGATRLFLVSFLSLSFPATTANSTMSLTQTR